MRTILLAALLPVFMTGCITLPSVKQQTKAVAIADAQKPKPNIFIERYDYEPPSATQIRVGRYTNADAVNTQQQENLLEVVIDTEIPSKAQTVGEAIEFLLMRSGFSMASPTIQGGHVKQLLSKPLPHAHRKIGPVMLKDALMMLVGKAYWMKVDPVHRLIAFDTVEEFK
ncbi:MULTISPECIES: hypothetical protein [unclassified Methylophaga]|uniref:PFGI-1 class ICE element type IV pilus protein PilL2 n=1 Tax=unclassified Methylophaga TaxID=2629249 RepID=UPI000C8F45BE|nr:MULTISPECIES: hypothetical protein [unclassified Methylophaga]MAP25460.1 pili assembly chaperone [Methylophaga sp.]MAP28362.1 pili assembly chaperone [Methylophaga sp.]HBX60541.1 pili assembly chaperone [Methylophaga sp.]